VREGGLMGSPGQMHPIALAAYLGSPASDTARVIGVGVLDLYDDRGSEVRSPTPRQRPLGGDAGDRLGWWLAALTWWNDWRSGGRGASSPDVVRAVGIVAAQLDAWPVEFARDLGLAQQGYWLATPDGERTQARPTGHRDPRAKLSWEDIEDAREEVLSGATLRRVAARMGVSHSTLSRALRRE
jgi:hypothetical protein